MGEYVFGEEKELKLYQSQSVSSCLVFPLFAVLVGASHGMPLIHTIELKRHQAPSQSHSQNEILLEY